MTKEYGELVRSTVGKRFLLRRVKSVPKRSFSTTIFIDVSNTDLFYVTRSLVTSDGARWQCNAHV